MSREVEQLLRRAATGPTRELDTGKVLARARRQTRWMRAGTGVAGVVVVVAAVVGLVALPMDGTGPGVEVADEPDASEIDQPATAGDLEGRTFVSNEIAEDGSPRQLVDDTVLTVTFDAVSPYRQVEGEAPGEGVDGVGWLRWDAGCNRHESAVVTDGGTLELVDRGSVTYRGCPGDEKEQDQWLRDFFDASPAWQLDSRQLTLAADDIMIVLEETEPAVPTPEAGDPLPDTAPDDGPPDDDTDDPTSDEGAPEADTSDPDEATPPEPGTRMTVGEVEVTVADEVELTIGGDTLPCHLDAEVVALDALGPQPRPDCPAAGPGGTLLALVPAANVAPAFRPGEGDPDGSAQVDDVELLGTAGTREVWVDAAGFEAQSWWFPDLNLHLEVRGAELTPSLVDDVLASATRR